MTRYLLTLTNSQFRTAGCILSERILTALSSEEYWTAFTAVVPRHTKAYLQTFLKAGVGKYVQGSLSLYDVRIEDFGHWVAENGTVIDERKVITAFLPVVKTEGEVRRLFDVFHVENLRLRIHYLLPVETVAVFYVLFQCMRKIDHAPALLTAYCNRLMEGGTGLSYNLVSIIKCYFDLPDVNGRFSLRLNDYELSRLDASYDDFKRIICSI